MTDRAPSADAATETRRRIAASDAEIPVMAASHFNLGGKLLLGGEEVVRCTSVISGPAGDPVLAGCLRGQERDQNGGPARSWPAGTAVEQVPWTTMEVTPFFADPSTEQITRMVMFRNEAGQVGDTIGIGYRDDAGEPQWFIVNNDAPNDASLDFRFRTAAAFGSLGPPPFPTLWLSDVHINRFNGEILLVDIQGDRVQRLNQASLALIANSSITYLGTVSGGSAAVMLESSNVDGKWFVAIGHSAAIWRRTSTGGADGSALTVPVVPTALAMRETTGDLWWKDYGGTLFRSTPGGAATWSTAGSTLRGSVTGLPAAYSGVFIIDYCFDANGDLWILHVVPGGPSPRDHYIARVNPATMAVAGVMYQAKTGSGFGRLSNASHIDADADGFIYVADTGGKKVVKFRGATGEAVAEYGQARYNAEDKGTVDWYSSAIGGLSVSRDNGEVALATFTSTGGSVIRLRPVAAYVTVIGTPTNIGGNGNSGNTSVACSGGSLLISGGCAASGNNHLLSDDYPSVIGKNGVWFCASRNNSGSGQNLTAYAVCFYPEEL
jgi:hypothetical protein